MKTPTDNIPEAEVLDYDAADDTQHYENEAPAEPAPMEQDPSRFYFLATVKILFLRDGKPKERTVNVLLDLVVPFINQKTINDLNRAAAGRVMKEGNIPGDNIKEAVVMNISLLGQMTDSMFKAEDIMSASMDSAIEPSDAAPEAAPVQ